MSFGNAAKSGFTLEDLTKMGPDEITRKRKIAEALLAQSQGIHPIANPLEGMAQMAQALIGNLKGARLDRAEREGKEGANALFSAGMGMGEFPAAPGGGSTTSSGGGSSGSGMRGDDIAWKDATPEQRAFLNTLAGPESGGRYNVIYGGGKFGDFSHHPETAVRIQTGPNAGRTSSAAGKYQFLGSTWKQTAAELGLPDFSPESQDKGAWHLADKTFKAKTGQDLLTVLKSGDPKAIAAAGSTLRDVWTSLPGGIEQGTNQDRFVASYQKYMAQGASPAQAQQAATQETGAPAPNTPVQVASLDPKAGVEAAMREQGQDPNDPLSQALVKLKQQNTDGSTAPLPQQAAIGAALTGQPVPTSAKQALFIPGVSDKGLSVQPIPNAQPLAAGVDPMSLMDPAVQRAPGSVALAPDAYGAIDPQKVPPINDAQTVVGQPPAAQVPMPAPPQAALPQQQQIGQALVAQNDPAQTLGAPAISPQGPDMRTLMNMAGNEFMSPSQQKMIEALTGQRMKQADPEYQLDLETKRAQLDALKNPQLSPAERANLEWKQKEFDAGRGDKAAEYDLNVKKFGAEEADRMRQQADREADNKRADKDTQLNADKFDYEKQKDALPEYYDAYVKQETAAGRQPLGILDFITTSKKAGAQNITVGGTTIEGEKKYDQTVGEGYGKRFVEAQDQAQAAQQTLSSLDVMEQAMSDPSFYSGSGAEYVNGLKRMAASVGINPDGVSSAESFGALAKKAALDSMGGSLGSGFSNADRDFVTGQVPSLDNTPEGNKKLIDIQRKLNGRKIEIAQLAREYATKHEGRIGPGFDDELASWAKANPLFPDPKASLPTPKTDMEYDKLPSGAMYIDPEDGQTYKKP